MANKFTEKAERSLSKVLDAFKDPDKLVDDCAKVTFPMVDMPSCQWTLRNRFLAMFQSGEIDCRGFKQWKKADRTVKKGANAVYILAPLMVPEKKDGVVQKDSKGKTKLRCIGFKAVAVFSVNDTEGKPLSYENPEIINRLPLIELAEAEGIAVKGRPFDGASFGSYSPLTDTIILCTEDEKTYLHEVSHWFDNKRSKEEDGKGIKGGQHWDQEIVAELSAAVLARLYGKQIEVRKDTYNYIKTYANRNGMEVLDACLSVLNRTAKVVGAIIEAAENLNLKGNEGASQAA